MLTAVGIDGMFIVFSKIISCKETVSTRVDRDLPYTAEEMDHMFRQLTMPGIEAALLLKKF